MGFAGLRSRIQVDGTIRLVRDFGYDDFATALS